MDENKEINNEKILEENIDKVEPMTHTLDNFIYELREDVIEESTDIDDLLSNCDDYINDEVRVPKVVE